MALCVADSSKIETIAIYFLTSCRKTTEYSITTEKE
jgi:hypothetical protein